MPQNATEWNEDCQIEHFLFCYHASKTHVQRNTHIYIRVRARRKMKWNDVDHFNVYYIP